MRAIKRQIKEYALNLGIDDLGVAGMDDLPGTSRLKEIMPAGKSLLVMLLKEIGSGQTDDPQAAMNGRLDMNSFVRHTAYRMTRYLEKNFKAKVVTLPYSYPMAFGKSKVPMGIVSLRHAAVAAGLGVMGRHNLFMHPEMGTRVGIFALLSDLELPIDQPYSQDLCINCDICVQKCPARALDEPGKTDVAKCMATSQSTGMGANVQFWGKILAEEDGAQRKNMLRSPAFFSLLQTYHMGNQYYCFNCQKSCPIGQ